VPLDTGARPLNHRVGRIDAPNKAAIPAARQLPVQPMLSGNAVAASQPFKGSASASLPVYGAPVGQAARISHI
jgi:hypothetical protein